MDVRAQSRCLSSHPGQVGRGDTTRRGSRSNSDSKVELSETGWEGARQRGPEMGTEKKSHLSEQRAKRNADRRDRDPGEETEQRGEAEPRPGSRDS